MDYILDLTKKLSIYNVVLEKLKMGQKLESKDKLIPLRETKQNPIPFESIKVRHTFYYDIGDVYNTEFVKIRITHIHGDVIFFKKVKSKDRKEYYIDKCSLAYIYKLFPIKVIILKDWTVQSVCNLIEYIEK